VWQLRAGIGEEAILPSLTKRRCSAPSRVSGEHKRAETKTCLLTRFFRQKALKTPADKGVLLFAGRRNVKDAGCVTGIKGKIQLF
jgi:hypothetical protein